MQGSMFGQQGYNAQFVNATPQMAMFGHPQPPQQPQYPQQYPPMQVIADAPPNAASVQPGYGQLPQQVSNGNGSVEMKSRGVENHKPVHDNSTALDRIVQIDPNVYQGDDASKVKAMVAQNPIMIFSRSTCPFCLELKRTFNEIGVQTTVVETDKVSGGSGILAAAKSMSGHKTVPIAYIKGQFAGGCDDVKADQTKGLLTDKLAGLPQRPKVVNAYNMDSIQLVVPHRGKAVHPLFWFPNVVNNYVVRLTGLFVTALCAICIAFHEYRTGKWISAFLLLDFSIRLFVASSLSPLGMLATLLVSPLKPQFKPGPPKQFAACCGVCFTLVGTACFFTGHPIPGACVIGGLLGAAAMEAFLDFCLGCVFYGLGIRFGLVPPYVYRIYTNIRQETEEGWDYENIPSGARAPEPVDTDPTSEVALKYKVRTDEWTKDDFNLIRNMQVSPVHLPGSMLCCAPC